ncbi:MAG TPA: ABC transporter substrate-binding protein [Streptosporangiaceae bacterium]
MTTLPSRIMHSRESHGRMRHRSIVVTSVLAATGLALAACGGSSGGSSSGHGGSARGGTLTVGTDFSNGSLDPAKADPGTDPLYLDPLYAPLLRFAPNGQLEGVLAASFGYVGSGNKVFQLTLRPGVKFSNGQPVTGAAVAASIRHFKTGSNGGPWLVNCPAVTAPSATRVRISCTRPDPDIAQTLSERLLGGDIVAPASLAHPATLGTDPIGAGEYTLDAAQTVTGSTYTYVANPRYFDQKAIHWDKIVVKYLANASSALDSLRSGQIQELWTVDPETLTAAQGDGMPVSSSALGFEGVNLADRSAGHGNPLGSLKVRQALEYAVNRPAIVKALYGKSPGAAATDEVAIPSEPSAYDPAVNNYYPYDPAKARQLLARAGYPHGFTIKVEDQGDTAELTQAVIGYWNAVGVQAKVTADTTVPGWSSNVLSKKFPAMGFAYGGLPMYMEAINFFEPSANIFNPFATNDAQITGLISAAISAPAAQQNTDFQKIQAAGVQQAGYLAVTLIPVGLLHAAGVDAPPIDQGYYGNDTDVTPAS